MFHTANKDFTIGDRTYDWRIHVRSPTSDMYFHLRKAIGHWKDVGKYFFFTDLTDAMNFRIIFDEEIVEIHQSLRYSNRRANPLPIEEVEEISPIYDIQEMDGLSDVDDPHSLIVDGWEE